MTTTIKISPIPRNLTEEQIRDELGHENATRIILIGDAAYVTLPDSRVLEELTGKYGDGLRINDWSSTIQPLEAPTVSLRGYAEKMGKMLNIILVVWLICLLM